MSNDRWAGLMLILGSVGLLITLGLHPSGRELFSPATFEAAARKLIAVHSLALAALPLWFAGALGLSRRIGSQDSVEQNLASTGLVFYGCGLITMMTGIVFDGLVSPSLAGQINNSTGTVGQGWRIAFNYNGMLDMAFMRVFLAASSIALGLWSAAILRGRVLPRAAGVMGSLLALAILALLFSGQLDRNEHFYGVIFLGEALWMLLMGVLLLRAEPAR
jgi:hypothetical protein